jgi:hypothetical protein
MHRSALFVLIAFVLPGTIALLPPAVASPGGDGGIEVWVDGPAAIQPGTDRTFPDVAMNPAGEAIHVWNAFNGMTLRNDIFLRRFDAAGNPLADPVQVNTLTGDDQDRPRIAVSADGSFLVIWQSDEFDDGAGAVRRWIRGQAYAANASPVGGERLISAASTGYGSNIRADVAALSGGGYVVVWEQNGAGGSDTNAHIRARLVGADGAPGGDSFVANSAIGASEVDPAVTEIDGGGFLVVWIRGEVYGRAFNSAGLAQGDDFQLNTNLEGAEGNPDVARGTDDRILMVWEDAEGAGDDYEIRGRMFTSALTALGDDFRINTLIAGVQLRARVGSYGRLGFLVAWESEVSAGDDADPQSIQGRTVTGNGQFGGSQFQLNRWTSGNQELPCVGGMGERVSVAWHSGSNELSLTDDVIMGQSWSVCGIFCDGFE